VHQVSLIIRIYHDARPPERQIFAECFYIFFCTELLQVSAIHTDIFRQLEATLYTSTNLLTPSRQPGYVVDTCSVYYM